MAHVIVSSCTREGDCVEVCPVDCIVPGPTDDDGWNDLFFIDPDTCIDCGACVPVCPPEAIFPEEDVPEEYEADIQRNADYFSEGPGYWDFDLEEERATLNGKPKEQRLLANFNVTTSKRRAITWSVFFVGAFSPMSFVFFGRLLTI